MKYQFELIDHKTIFAEFFTVDSYRLRHESFRGGWLAPVERVRIEGLNAVSVLLYDAGRDCVALVEQFRIGAMESGEGAWLLETVGGYREPDEAAEDVARREVREEAGCDVLGLVSICEFYVSPGISSERISLFCARVNASGLGAVHGLADEGEETRVVVMSADEAVRALYGRINSTSAIIALQWFAMHRNHLKHRWAGGP